MLIALALVRHDFRGKGAADLLDALFEILPEFSEVAEPVERWFETVTAVRPIVAVIFVLIFSALPEEALLLSAAASVVVTAYRAVLPVIVVGDLRFGAAILLLRYHEVASDQSPHQSTRQSRSSVNTCAARLL